MGFVAGPGEIYSRARCVGPCQTPFMDRWLLSRLKSEGETVVVSDSWGDCLAMNNPARIGVLRKEIPVISSVVHQLASAKLVYSR